MDLRCRPLERRDMDGCLRLFRGRLAYPSETLFQLSRCWNRLLADEAMVTAVIENHEIRERPQILAFGGSVFVADPYMCEARRGLEPYLSARTVALEVRGRSPILRPEAIRRVNADGGLNLLLLHYVEDREGLGPGDLPSVRYRMLEAMLTNHRGYRIREVLQEFWDEIELSFILNGWGRLRTDYTDFFRNRGLAPPPPERRPYLIGLTDAEASANPGDMAAPLFVYAPPRFVFSRGEQRLLARARLGETDGQIAGSLQLALPTVKGRWRQIYARVAAVSPDLLGDPDPDPGGQTRGKEKRRRLLEYLQRHPEELHCHARRRVASPAARTARVSRFGTRSF
jgi:DNA-binding CsgD family transcriptional regulator